MSTINPPELAYPPSGNLLPNPNLPQRVVSIDALRGFVMFTMIFVNDLAGGGKKVPDWMVHFSDRHKGNVSGMTFVDLVFPAFLFIVGMSIPIALSGRLAKGEPVWKLLLHIIIRTVSLLAIGILMVNGEGGHANSKLMGFSGTTWTVLMFCSALLAFCTISPPSWAVVGPTTKRSYRVLTFVLRVIGLSGMFWTAIAFRSGNGGQILSLDPFSIHTSWYGILGLIGWSYLVASIAFLICRTNRTALLACVALLVGLNMAGKKGTFNDFWLNDIVSIGGMLGAHPSISVAGVLLGTIFLTPETSTVKARSQFTLFFFVGFSAAAMLLTPQWGISKNAATPAWCLWASAITAALWLLFYLVSDVLQWRFLSRPLAIAGENVLLAYILSEMMEAVFHLLGWGHWYDGLNEPYLVSAIARSAGCGIFILSLTALLNRLGFRLKL